jgi:beta-phosphoglucomutase
MPENPAIVFDFDGVIVDSERLHHEAFLAVGAALGVSFDYAAYQRDFIGFDDRDALRAMLRMSRGLPPTPAGSAAPPVMSDEDEAQVERWVGDKALAFEAMTRERSPQELALPGAVELIDAARDAGWPIAIASGASRRDIDLMLGVLKIADRFEVIVSADDVERSKPDPASYTRAVEQLGVVPAQTLAIEDTAAGIRSAKAAGLTVLGIRTTSPAAALRQADAVRDSLRGATLEDLRDLLSAS